MRLYVNGFPPSLKLRTKTREGSHVQRTYETPVQRVLSSGILRPEAQTRVEALFQTRDPVRLLRQRETLQDALGKQAILTTPSTSPSPQTEVPATPFRASACGLSSPQRATTLEAFSLLSPPPPGTKRKYRRTNKVRAPRPDRTRVDPFASVWEAVCQELAAAPERPSQSLVEEGQQASPGVYRDTQLRTLQRHVKEWRACTILTFEDQWVSEDNLSEPHYPHRTGVICAIPEALSIPESRPVLPVGM